MRRSSASSSPRMVSAPSAPAATSASSMISASWGCQMEALNSAARNTRSTPRSSATRSLTWRSSTASSWGAASGCPCTAVTVSPASATLLPCKEVGIGFFPDVGATYALPRLSRQGRHLSGRSPARGSGRGMRWPSVSPPGTAVEDRCGRRDRAAALVGQASPSIKSSAAHAERLTKGRRTRGEPRGDRRVFSPAPASRHRQRALEGAMGQKGSAFASEAATTMATKSPTSLAIALEQMRRG